LCCALNDRRVLLLQLGQTALILAAWQNCLEVVRVLLHAGANPVAADEVT
jgi:ankyrin repeat protein